MVDFYTPDYVVIIGFVFLHIIVISTFFRSLLKYTSALYLSFLVVWRLMVANYYWYYTLSENADSKRFYLEALYLQGGWLENFGTGTDFINFLIYPMVNYWEWSYYTCFYAFEFIGFLGILLLLRHYYNYSAQVPRLFGVNILLIIFLLPTFNFFTTSIGKDGLVFLGISLFIVSLKNINKNYLWIIGGAVLIVLIRPHIFFLLVACLLLSILVRSRTIRFSQKMVVLSFAVLVSFFAFPFLLERLSLDSISSDSLVSRIEQQNTYNQHSGTTIDIPIYNIPLRLFTFYFRPFFFDINGFLAVIASFENLIWLLMFIRVASLGFLKKVKHGSFLLSFHLLFFLIGGVVMAMSVNNVGLALRQKIMFLPSLIYIFSVWYDNRSSVKNATRTTLSDLTPRQSSFSGGSSYVR